MKFNINDYKGKYPIYLYESHLGGYYTGDKEYGYDLLYCEECGDSDLFLGRFDDDEELWDFIVDLCYDEYIDINYAHKFAQEMFEIKLPLELGEDFDIYNAELKKTIALEWRELYMKGEQNMEMQELENILSRLMKEIEDIREQMQQMQQAQESEVGEYEKDCATPDK